jgi:hypothetical protein
MSTKTKARIPQNVVAITTLIVVVTTRSDVTAMRSSVPCKYNSKDEYSYEVVAE